MNDLNISTKIIKFLEKNIGVKSSWFGIWQSVLTYDTQSGSKKIREKIDKLINYIGIETVCTNKGHYQ